MRAYEVYSDLAKLLPQLSAHPRGFSPSDCICVPNMVSIGAIVARRAFSNHSQAREGPPTRWGDGVACHRVCTSLAATVIAETCAKHYVKSGEKRLQGTGEMV
jgi:hypothetical protein